MSRFSLPLIVLCCLAMPCRADESLADWAKKAQGRHAYGQYVGGKKAGFTIEELKLGKHDGKDVLTYVVRDHLAMKYDDEVSVKDETTTQHYELTGNGELLYAKRERTENKKTITTITYELTRQKKGMRLTIRQGKKAEESRTISTPKDTLAVARGMQQWFSQPRKAGDRYDNYRLDWESDENGHLDQKETYVFGKKITTRVYGKETPGFAVTVIIDGGKLISEVMPDGRLIRGKLGNLLSLELEKEAVAKKMGAPPELMESTSVALDRDLEQASLIDELKLRIKGLGDFEIPASHRQIVKKEKDAVLLTVKRDFRVEKAVQLTKQEEKTYTSATPRVQCDHKAIVAQAKKIVGDEKDALKKAKLLSKWVYDTLKKSYSVAPERAIDVLEQKVGACREHTLLFVALARAVGVPAREVGGLAFTRANDKPMMGWHAWAEIHDGHQWVSMDPTWNQTYVDGTHVKASEGDKDQTWANVAGEMKIEVVDVSKRSLRR